MEPLTTTVVAVAVVEEEEEVCGGYHSVAGCWLLAELSAASLISECMCDFIVNILLSAFTG